MDTILLGPVCKTSKNIYNAKLLIGNSFDGSSGDYLPQEHIFALGIDNIFQVIDMMALQTTISDLSDPSHG